MPLKTLGNCDDTVLEIASIALPEPREHALGKASKSGHQRR